MTTQRNPKRKSNTRNTVSAVRAVNPRPIKPTEQMKRIALGVAFGVMFSGSTISGIPSNIPGLTRAVSCTNCTLRLSNGVPSQFSAIMTDEQKKLFKKALKKQRGK